MNINTIHIEGLDLAGKSTICRFISNGYGFKIRNNVLTKENPLIQEADYLRKNGLLDDVALGQRYFDALQYDLEHYESAQEPIIQDSTIIIRSIAFHSVIGDKNLANQFRQLLPRHPRFTKSFVLISSDEVRLSRLVGRCRRKNDSPEDHLIKSAPDIFHRMEDIIVKLVTDFFDGEIINSSHMEEEGEKERIAEQILKGVL